MKQVYENAKKMNLVEINNELVWLRDIAERYFKLINLPNLRRYVTVLHVRQIKLRREMKDELDHKVA